MGLISRVSSRTYRYTRVGVDIPIQHSSCEPKCASFPVWKFIQATVRPTFVPMVRVLLINGKSEKLLKGKKNPRKVTWTILYRRKHKKGTMTELESRKRNRRALKTQRGIAGQSWA